MDDKQFVQYVSQFQNTVFRIAYSYIKNTTDSEDIMQDVFLKLYKSNENFTSEENVKAWLIRVTINASKDYLRSAWFRKRTNLEERTILVAKTEEDSDIFEAMVKLGGKYKTVLYLHYYEGYSVKEIANLLQISETNTKARLKRGRDALREFLKGEDGKEHTL